MNEQELMVNPIRNWLDTPTNHEINLPDLVNGITAIEIADIWWELPDGNEWCGAEPPDGENSNEVMLQIMGLQRQTREVWINKNGRFYIDTDDPETSSQGTLGRINTLESNIKFLEQKIESTF